MLNGKKVCVVMPAYNAEKTLQKTYDEIPKDIVDEIILTDDASKDKTVEVAEKGKIFSEFMNSVAEPSFGEISEASLASPLDTYSISGYRGNENPLVFLNEKLTLAYADTNLSSAYISFLEEL